MRELVDTTIDVLVKPIFSASLMCVPPLAILNTRALYYAIIECTFYEFPLPSLFFSNEKKENLLEFKTCFTIGHNYTLKETFMLRKTFASYGFSKIRNR